MKEFDITKMPFTSISRENWQMLVDLDAETLYSVIQNVGNYVITGERCDCDNTLSKVVCNQLISVIDRKAEKSFNSAKNLTKTKTNEELTEQERWLNAIKEENGNPYELFNKYWNRYFNDINAAKRAVSDYLAKYNKHLTL